MERIEHIFFIRVRALSRPSKTPEHVRRDVQDFVDANNLGTLMNNTKIELDLVDDID